MKAEKFIGMVQPKNIKNLFQKDNIAAVEFSFQREIAALGAAWKKSC